MKKNLLFIFIGLICNQFTFAQSTEIRPGIILPQMTTAQRNSLGANATNGMLVFDTGTQSYWYRQNGNWVDLAAAGGGWSTNNSHIYNANSGNIGIGIQAPKKKLEINSGNSLESGLKLSRLGNSFYEFSHSSTFENLNSPSAIAYDQNNNYYVTSLFGNVIYKNGVALTISGEPLNNPYCIVYGADGNLYVSNYGNNSILKITTAGVSSIFVPSSAGLSHPIGLAFDSSGNLYVVNNTGNKRLSKISPSGNVISLNFSTSSFTDARQCTIDVADNCYVTDMGAGEVSKIDLSNGTKTTFRGGITGNCHGITTDANGTVYVGLETDNKIVRVDPNGVSDFYTTNKPVFLTFSTHGSLMATNFSDNTVTGITAQLYHSLLAVTPTGDVTLTNLPLFYNENFKMTTPNSTKPSGFYADGTDVGIKGVGGNAGVKGEGVQYGVFGYSATATGLRGDGLYYGVFGQTTTGTGVGVRGVSISNTGVSGSSDTGYGVYATSLYNNAIKGVAYSASAAVSGESQNGNGVFGWGKGTQAGIYAYCSSTGEGIRASSSLGNAGYFSGNVVVTGSISKGSGSFKIDHPLDPANKYLYHSFVESPDMMNIYNGNITTNANGEATIQLPDYFEALNRDFRYQLTPIGSFARAMIAEKVNNNQFRIKTDLPNVEVSWQVTGIRQDAFANTNRIPVVEEKKESEKGLYLHPTAFGYEKTKGLDYLKDKGMRDTLNLSDSSINKK